MVCNVSYRLGFLFVCLCLMVGMPAFASPDVATEEERQAVDFSDVPDAYIKEAQKVYQTCTRHAVRPLYFDCKCFSMRFLEERMDKGNAPSTASLEFNLRNECRDSTGAAGQEYNNCLNSNSLMKPGTDPEAFCSCYGNTFSRLVDNAAPAIQSKSLNPFKVQARVTCNDPALANRLYGGYNY